MTPNMEKLRGTRNNKWSRKKEEEEYAVDHEPSGCDRIDENDTLNEIKQLKRTIERLVKAEKTRKANELEEKRQQDEAKKKRNERDRLARRAREDKKKKKEMHKKEHWVMDTTRDNKTLKKDQINAGSSTRRLLN